MATVILPDLPATLDPGDPSSSRRKYFLPLAAQTAPATASQLFSLAQAPGQPSPTQVSSLYRPRHPYSSPTHPVTETLLDSSNQPLSTKNPSEYVSVLPLRYVHATPCSLLPWIPLGPCIQSCLLPALLSPMSTEHRGALRFCPSSAQHSAVPPPAPCRHPAA